jgi:peptide/nickel transport system ATP-binding protein
MLNRNLVEIRDLSVNFETDEGVVKAVDGVSLDIIKGRTLGIVGESGCGKSVTAQALLRIVPRPGKITGRILLYEQYGKQLEEPIDLVKLASNGGEIRKIRGGTISMIFQEPMKAFSPLHTIGNQITEGIMLHSEPDHRKARAIAIDILREVGIANPEQRIDQYPHQLSGGMRQRAMIAMALSCNPSLLIADEPTTALDVTVQAQVLMMINNLKNARRGTVMFITHDLGVIAEMADDVAVMYLGKAAEYADVDPIFHSARHPYTLALLKSIPSLLEGESKKKLFTIEGTVPYAMNLPPGCGFYSRCPFGIDGKCNVEDIPYVEKSANHFVRCIYAAGAGKVTGAGAVAGAGTRAGAVAGTGTGAGDGAGVGAGDREERR